MNAYEKIIKRTPETFAPAAAPDPGRLWTKADLASFYRSSPRTVATLLATLKAKLFPMDDVTVPQVAAWIDQLIEANLVVEYQAIEDSEHYWHVTGWDRHQRIEKPSYKYPQPPERMQRRAQAASESKVGSPLIAEKSSTASPLIVEKSPGGGPQADGAAQTGRRTPPPGVEWSGVEWSGVEGNGLEFSAEAIASASPSALAVGQGADSASVPQAAGRKRGRGAPESPEFYRFWAAYPRKDGKHAAAKAFKALNPSSELLDLMLAAVEQQKHSEQWIKEGGKYIPQPSTWLNGRRWEDQGVAAPAAGAAPPTHPDQPAAPADSADLVRAERFKQQMANAKKRAVPPPAGLLSRFSGQPA